MTERDAWLAVAEAWRNAVKDDDVPEAYSVEGTYGICGVVRTLPVTSSVIASMVSKLPPAGHGRTRQYCWPLTAEGAKERVEFCERMASELDECEPVIAMKEDV